MHQIPKWISDKNLLIEFHQRISSKSGENINSSKNLWDFDIQFPSNVDSSQSFCYQCSPSFCHNAIFTYISHANFTHNFTNLGIHHDWTNWANCHLHNQLEFFTWDSSISLSKVFCEVRHVIGELKNSSQFSR